VDTPGGPGTNVDAGSSLKIQNKVRPDWLPYGKYSDLPNLDIEVKDVSMGELSYEDQVRLMAQSAIVVGIHG